MSRLAATKVIDLEQVIATHRHEWGKWPDTDDMDYGPVLALRETWVFRHGDTELRVHNRFYPVYSAYIAAGDLILPVRFPVINNLSPPSEQVLEQQRIDLRNLSQSCRAILWEHAHQCFPAVVYELPELFPTVRALHFADDCPGSSDIKTFPVAAFFNAISHAMFVWNPNTGSLTADEYHRRGLSFTRFFPSQMTVGLAEGLADLGFSFEAKVQLVRRGEASPDLVFVGYAGGGERLSLMRGLCLAHARQQQSKLRMKLYGVGLPDGVLEPRDPPHPKGLGFPVASLYSTALSSVNVPVSSLFNSRLADLWLTGTVQFVRDRWGELPKMGFVPGEHYLPFDGTSDDLLGKLESLKSRPGDAADLLVRARQNAAAFFAANDWNAVYSDIYFHFIDEIAS